ncbi:MAG TPA: EpsD family peptidyl-prolyl cis-trans isomerase [Cellvibrionaceae bacterium]
MAANIAPSKKMFTAAFCSLLVSLGLAGCGDDKPKTTQVAAKVNGEEISVHQINSLLAKTPNLTADMAEKVRGEVLEKLIDQELMFAQARSKKLDRTPEVVTAIETAKREIIARAHLEQVISTLPKVTEQEVKQYYENNKALFAERRIYNLEEVSVDAKPEILPKLKTLVDTKSLDELTSELTALGAQARKGAATRAAEQIGMDLLPQLAKVKDGDNALIIGNKNYLVVHVISSKSEPISIEQATPKIAQFLQTQRVQKAVTDETKRLREAAKIEYQGEFNKSAAPPAAK